MELVTIGTGDCTPRIGRGGPCTLVRWPGGAAVVDLGLGALRGLLAAGTPLDALDAVFFTHLHPDHVAELVSLLFASNYADPPRVRPLLLAGGPGFEAHLAGLCRLHGHWLDARSYARHVREVAAGVELEVGRLRVRPGSVRHIASSVAWRLELDGASAVVSGDTGPSPELEALARGADLLVLEAGNPTAQGAEVHLTPRQAGELARRAGARALVLHHLPPSLDPGRAEVAAAEAFGRSVALAADGACFPVGAPSPSL